MLFIIMAAKSLAMVAVLSVLAVSAYAIYSSIYDSAEQCPADLSPQKH